MPQIHLHAEAGDYAPLVLLPGDPARATRIAARFDGGLAGARLVNEHRGLLGYTGTVAGRPVSVQTTGMGAPSIAIVAEELLRMGARQLVRLGTTGALRAEIHLGDLIIATASTPTDGATISLMGGKPYAPAADFGLTHALVHAAERLGVPFRVGPITTIDIFSHYHPDPNFVRPWREAGALAVEMEASALFYLAAARGVQAACLGVVVDVDSGETNQEHTYLSPDELEAAVERMIDVALSADFG
ncbi:MAG TPA: purine-nucleoside phosphorylase [Candidatus Limnocylindria bacterium]|nr:purine-nucleoside phosphorylase [Candidatus Limnocylindria bacterium]